MNRQKIRIEDMRKLFIITALFCSFQAFAQLTSAEYKEKYERQVKNVGYCGIGVETVLDNWEKVAPDDPEPKLGRFYFYLSKSQATKMVIVNSPRYLGNAPSLTLKDSEGKDINYFEDNEFDDACFAESQKVIDALIKDYPYELEYRFAKAASLLSYEKEYPDATVMELSNVISLHSKNHPAWTYKGSPVSELEFADFIQQYCSKFYSIGSPVSYEAFKKLSLSMSQLFPKSTLFLDNQGSYWLVCEKNYKKAISFYDKALRIDPEDQVAIKNRKIAERLLLNSKKKK